MPTTLTLHLPTPHPGLSVRAVRGGERLGEPFRYHIDLVSPTPIDSLLEQPAGLYLASEFGERWIPGLITQFSRRATSDPNGARRYSITLEPSWATLRFRRNSRVFQHISVPDLIREVLLRAGFPPDRVDIVVREPHPPRSYLVQWLEDDLAFIRRLAEEEGLFFRAASAPDGERFALEDTSSSAPSFDTALTVVDQAGLHIPGLTAWEPELISQRRAGSVTLRDHNPARPAAKLEATLSAGTGIEQDTEVYLAPGRFRSDAEGDLRAKRMLESLRWDTTLCHFKTNALGLSAGNLVDLRHGPDYDEDPPVEGTYLVVSVDLAYDAEGSPGGLQVTAIPAETPFRLPRVSPQPRIAGVQAAVVTGPPGSEIHPDADGSVFVRFFWDREGPHDDKSSLPVRVLQPNMPGSMVLPRVGWEVAVAFEDGDPDRPYVLGRVYNAKSPPPVALPANKTMTMLRTFSSPGGGAHNTISFNDSAGAQNLAIHAGFGKSTSVGDSMLCQTVNVEEQGVGVNQTVTIGGNDALTVKQTHRVSTKTQSASVAGSQNIYVQGHLNVAVGSESVAVGGALLEKVGNPVTGAINLGAAAVLAGAGALGEKLGGKKAIAAAVATGVAGVGWGMVQAGMADGAGLHAVRDAGIRGSLGALAGIVPGGDAVMASVTGGGRRLPWEDPPAEAGAAEAGGGAGAAASDGAGAKGAGPGHRNELVKGPYAELIGGAHAVATPGSVKWQTTGAASLIVGGGHATKTIKAHVKVRGASEETLGSLHVKTSGPLIRGVKGAVATTVAAALSMQAKGVFSQKAGSKISITAGGPLTCTGGVVSFVVGSSLVAASSGGVLIKAPKITIQGATTQSGDTTH